MDRYHRHNIEVVIDRLIIGPGIRARVAEALDEALTIGSGTALLVVMEENATTPRGQRRRNGKRDILLSSAYACPTCNLSFEPPNPQMFSFNSPQGMCAYCDGWGHALTSILTCSFLISR